MQPVLFPSELIPERPMSVGEVTAQIKDLLETAFPIVWVTGEVSNFSRPQSGHCYLTLKDDDAQLKAAIWRNVATRIRFDLHDGMEVVCRGHLDVYAPRGTYQLIIEQIEPVGIGALELALRQLKEKLAKEGLFDPARKKTLPPFVRKIAVVTSPTGAAIRDFLQVLGRRWRGADVLIVPTRVQGEGASQEIAEAIEIVNRLADPVDVMVVTRGGGSLEDLWAFNEEPTVRAIAASRIPVISAIGHEIDVTLADLAADVRALTPSEAAEIVAPETDEILAALSQAGKRMKTAMRKMTSQGRLRLDAVARHYVFRRPFQLLFDRERMLDELSNRSKRAIEQKKLSANHHLQQIAARLESLSPLAVLGRGYSVTTRVNDGRLIRAADELSAGETIITRFSKGKAISRVEKTEKT